MTESLPQSTAHQEIMIVAGEASGDILGAKLARALYDLDQHLFIYGVGAEQMKQTGVDILMPASELSVVGLIEVIKHYPRLKQKLEWLKRTIINKKPDLLILIDFPDFNLRLAEAAKKIGIKILYYISPQIWAWRPKRIEVIKKNIDRMAVAFPFEVDIYRQANIPVTYVGHPLIKDATPTLSKKEFYKRHGISEHKKLIGIFPGSRRGELKYILPTLLEAAALLNTEFQNVQFIIPIASTLSKEDFDLYLMNSSLNIHLSQDNIYDIIHACDAIAAASGTVTLQISLIGTPLLIVYKVAPFTFFLLRRFVRSKYAGISNILLEKEAIREFLQNDATPHNIAAELSKLIEDQKYVAELKTQLAKIKKILGEEDGSKNAARLAWSMLH